MQTIERPTSSSLDLLELPPGYSVGPTERDHGALVTLPWPGDPTLPWAHRSRLELLPLSLGPGIVNWAHRWLVHPLTGDPWRYTVGQRRFLHLWYAIDEDGRWLYRSGVKRGAKGTGKDPFLGSLTLVELCGPVEVIDIDGSVVTARSRRRSLVQVGANSKDQAAKVLAQASAMIDARMQLAYGLDPGLTRIAMSTGSRIELLKTRVASSEGDPPTASFLNESHHMLASNGGHATAAVARRNVGKSPREIGARLLEATNAHAQGADSVAEGSYDAWQNQVQGLTRKKDILYDSREAPPGLNIYDDDELMYGLRAAYSDADWADYERLRDEAQDERTPASESIRYYLNGLATAEDAWIEPDNFDALAKALIVEPGDQMAMFLDCSKSGDATTLHACRLSDGHVIELGVWAPKHGELKSNVKRGSSTDEGWRAPRAEVDAVCRENLDKLNVVWFGIDPSPAMDDATDTLYWMPMIDGIHRDYAHRLPLWATPGLGEKGGHAVLFDMRLSSHGAEERNRLFTQAAMQTAIDIDEDGTLSWDGSPTTRTHVHNARRRPNRWGVSIGKINRTSTRLVDGAVTLVGSRMGRRIALNSNKIATGGRQGGRGGVI